MDLTRDDILLIKTLLIIEMKELELYLLKHRNMNIDSAELQRIELSLEHTESLFDKFDSVKF